VSIVGWSLQSSRTCQSTCLYHAPFIAPDKRRIKSASQPPHPRLPQVSTSYGQGSREPEILKSWQPPPDSQVFSFSGFHPRRKLPRTPDAPVARRYDSWGYAVGWGRWSRRHPSPCRVLPGVIPGHGRWGRHHHAPSAPERARGSDSGRGWGRYSHIVIAWWWGGERA